MGVHPLAERVVQHIRRHELLKAGDRLGVAVSGGIDSVALLRLLLELRGELGVVLSVVHFNHKLRGAESDADESFVAGLARAHDLAFLFAAGDVAMHAREERVSVEAAARELRYGFFRDLLSSAEDMPTLSQNTQPGWDNRGLNVIATGHTLDDQAETVLMRMIRGAGLRGMGGIYPRLTVEDDDGAGCGEIVRPLLATRRSELEGYLKDLSQAWREDSSNIEDHFTRNRIRKLVVPLLEKEFNPSVAENLAELAEIARGEEDYWQNEVAGWMGTGVHWSHPEWTHKAEQKSLVQIDTGGGSAAEEELLAKIDEVPWLVMNATVDRLWFAGEPLAVQRRLIKAIGEEAGIPLEFKHVDEIVRFVTEGGGAGKELSLPMGWKVRREADEVIFVTPDLREDAPCVDYEYGVSCPGNVLLAETGVRIELRRVPAGEASAYNPENLLDADSVPGPFKVRNWRAGDRFWPGHTKSPKKIKELLQDRRVPRQERKQWPVVLCGDEIVWMRGFPPPGHLRAKANQAAVAILEADGESRS